MRYDGVAFEGNKACRSRHDCEKISGYAVCINVAEGKIKTVEDVENKEDKSGEQKHKLVKESQEKEKIKCCGKIG